MRTEPGVEGTLDSGHLLDFSFFPHVILTVFPLILRRYLGSTFTKTLDSFTSEERRLVLDSIHSRRRDLSDRSHDPVKDVSTSSVSGTTTQCPSRSRDVRVSPRTRQLSLYFSSHKRLQRINIENKKKITDRYNVCNS